MMPLFKKSENDACGDFGIKNKCMQATSFTPLMLQVKDVMLLLGYSNYPHAVGILKHVKKELKIDRKIRGVTIREFCTVYKLDEAEVKERIAQYKRA